MMTTSSKEKKEDFYCIKVKGVLDEKWADWFDGLSIQPAANDETLLTGPVADQAALYGMLAKIRDLGLTLLMVQLCEESKK
jgi:hypothetical protein